MDNNNNNPQQQPQVEVEDDQDIHHPPEEEEEEDDEEEEEEEDEEAMDDEEDDEPNGGGGGEDDTFIEGGIAGAQGEGDQSKTLASEADIVLYFLCTEPIKDHNDHPILKPGVKVRIGMGKNTRLVAVMNRYVQVCNQETNGTVAVEELEFVHTAVLKGQDTAEQGALMKDDVVRVRQNRWEVADKEKELHRLQRESDLSYLEQMRQFMDKEAFASAVLECRGRRPVPDKHRVFSFSTTQPRNSTQVFCDAALVSRRCPWLRRKMDATLLGLCNNPAPADRSNSVVSIPEPCDDMVEEEDGPAPAAPQAAENNNRKSIPDDDDLDEHPIQVLDFDPQPSNRNPHPDNNVAAAKVKAAQIESDEESTGGAPASSNTDGKIHVVIEDHSPDAMLLLLEYCYTNRVVCLGQEAFRVAARTKPAPREHKGNLPPNGTKRWSHRGEPTCIFALATATIALAEEASMARLSLMAEIAASHLVTSLNVVEALALCSHNAQMYGNALPRLRKAAMEIVFHARPYGTLSNSVFQQAHFQDAVQAKAPLLVPALFSGTADALVECLGKKRHHAFCERDWKTSLYTNVFKRLDQEDKRERNQERAKNRTSSPQKQEQPIMEPLVVDELDLLNVVASRKTLKRLRNHTVRTTTESSKRKRRDGN